MIAIAKKINTFDLPLTHLVSFKSKTMKIFVSIILLLLIGTSVFLAQPASNCEEYIESKPTWVGNSDCNYLSQFYPVGNSVVELDVNFIFLSPPISSSETGRWDTITQPFAQAMLDEINHFLDSIWPPYQVLPTPAPFIGKALIRFNLKSFSKLHTVYFDSMSYDKFGFFTSDPNAINVVYGVTTKTGVAPGLASPSNHEILMTDMKSYGLWPSQRGKGERMLLMHELLHCCGLWHTNKTVTNYSLSVLNTNGSILPTAPVDDYWFEDSIQYNSGTSNNIMANVWGTRRYLSPKQIYFMHNYIRTNPIIRKCVTNWPNYSVHCVADHNNDLYVSGTQNLSGTFLTPPGDLTILAGSDITLNNCIIMTEGSKIVIEPGAKLTITNGSINTFNCSNQWKGIEIRSSAWATQPVSQNSASMPPYNIGMLVANNATISNAIRAVSVGELDAAGNYIVGTGAGILYSESSKYFNNSIGIQFNTYQNTNDNLSYLKRDTFIVDQNFKSTQPIAAIRIRKSFGIDILGCYFEDEYYANSTAIEVAGGSIKVKDHCTSISGNNCNGILTQNEFSGFRQAIDIYNNVLTTIPSTIDHAIIDQTILSSADTTIRNQLRGGIYIGKNFGSQVTNCYIKTLKKANVASNIPLTYGLYLDNSKGYVVENNVFEGSSNWKTIGVCVNNSGYGANSVYNNTITAHGQGIWAQNINYDAIGNVTGLLMNCDDFVNGEYNIGVQSEYGSIAGVAPTQGIANTFNEQDNVRNTYDLLYSSCTNNQENKFKVETQNPFVLISHGSFKDSTSFHPWPQTNNSCSNQNEVHYVFGADPQNSRSIYCPINYLPSLSPQSLQQEFRDLDDAKKELNQTYVSKLDGGRTSDMLSIANSSISASIIVDSLISKDYLSDTVLKTFLLREDIALPNKKSIFEKNAPLHANLWLIVMGTLEMPNEEFNHWDSIQHANRLSPRASIESEYQLRSTYRDLVVNEKIRRFLNDSTGPVYDSIIKIYKTIDLPDSKLMLADVYIAAEKYDSATVVIEDLENEGEQNEDICKLLRYTLNLTQNSSYTDTLLADSSNYTYLVEAATSSSYFKQGYSRSILRDVYNLRIEEVRLEPTNDEYSSRSAPVLNETKAISKNQNLIEFTDIKVYPNPASNQLIVEYDQNRLNCSFKINELTGKTILNGSLNSSQVIGLETLINGLYLLHLYEQDNLIRSYKLVIMK